MAKISNRLSNLKIFGRYFFNFLKRRRANRVPKTIKKILVCQTAKLGDMVCTTPVFKVLKEKYPDVKLYVLGNKLNRELLANSDLVDGYIEREASINEMTQNIKKEKFDVSILVTPNFLILAALYLANIPLIVTPRIENGRSPYETIFYKILRKLVLVKSHRMGYYAPREYLKLLEPLGIFSEDTIKRLSFSKEAEERAISILQQSSFLPGRDLLVAIVSSAGNKIKEWPPENFARIADYLVEQCGAKIIITGSEDDKDIVEKMLQNVHQKESALNLQGTLNLDELKALISKVTLLIGVDTGPIYIAEAFGVPTIDIVGPIDEREQPPQGLFHKIVKLENRVPQLHVMNARLYDAKEARRQVRSITPEAVIAKIKELGHVIKIQNS